MLLFIICINVTVIILTTKIPITMLFKKAFKDYTVLWSSQRQCSIRVHWQLTQSFPSSPFQSNSCHHCRAQSTCFSAALWTLFVYVLGFAVPGSVVFVAGLRLLVVVVAVVVAVVEVQAAAVVFVAVLVVVVVWRAVACLLVAVELLVLAATMKIK